MMIKWNKIIYDNCLNKTNGLYYLKDLITNNKIDKFDLCLTDPLFNVGKQEIGWKYSHHTLRDKKIDYNDKMDEQEYEDFSYEWFDLAKEICNIIIFTPGYRNKQMWLKKENFDFLYWKNMYRRGSTRICYFKKMDIILVYGKLKKEQMFDIDVLDYDFGWNNVFDYKDLIHPHPKPRKLYEWIIEHIKPKTVLDPFVGSGTVAEVCKMKGIKYYCYEKNKIYKKDIEKRLNQVNTTKSGIFHWLK